MRSILNDDAHLAKLANQYNFDRIIGYLTDEDDPKNVAQHLKLIYFTLAEYIMNDDTQLCRYDVADAMCTLRCLHEAIEAMTNDDKRTIKIASADDLVYNL